MLVAQMAGAAEPANKPYPALGEIHRLDQRVNALLGPEAKLEILAFGFEWTEGPVWVPRDGGYLLFSDIPRNTIYKWKEDAGLSIYMRPAGYTGTEPWGPEPGTNGLLLDAQGRLVMCEHGDRRVTRLDDERSCIKTVLASSYQGKRLNSPNDAVFARNGDLYFTDPPYGLPQQHQDPRRELDWFGVYRVKPDGQITLLTDQMTRPNGIAFSPDEKTLYVAQSDPAAAIWRAFDVRTDGTLGDSRVLYDATDWVGKEKGLPDGMAVHPSGVIFGTGPGGVLIIHPDGTLLGLLATHEATSNCTFDMASGYLYVTVDMYVCRIKVEGVAGQPRAPR